MMMTGRCPTRKGFEFTPTPSGMGSIITMVGDSLGRNKGFAPIDQGFDDSLLMASGLYLPEDDANVVNAKLDFDPIDRFLWARLNYAASFNNRGDERFEPGDEYIYWPN